MNFFALSERGISVQNEDSYCAERIDEYWVFAVAEGLSGHPGGEIASGIAVGHLRQAVHQYPGSPRAALENAVREADAEIREASERSPARTGMATKITACIADAGLHGTLLDAGNGGALVITPDSVRPARDSAIPARHPGSTGNHPGNVWPPFLSDMVSHTLGAPRRLQNSDFHEIDLEETFLLLTSEGLTDFVRTDEIGKIVRANGGNLEASCEELVQAALSAGSDDTITLVLVQGISD